MPSLNKASEKVEAYLKQLNDLKDNAITELTGKVKALVEKLRFEHGFTLRSGLLEGEGVSVTASSTDTDDAS